MIENRKIVAYGVVLLALPFLLVAANPVWLTNTVGDLDVWMYYGYLNHLFQFSSLDIWQENAYIGTRIPYILPAYIVHTLFGDDNYRYIFGICVIYSSIVFSYFYILVKYLPLWKAAAMTVMIALNFYLLRSIGWDYVDRGEAAYEALTFALLTLAGTTKRPWIATIGAGFAAASMVFVHLATGLLFPVFFLYSGFVVRRARSVRDWAAHAGHLLLFGSLGAALAQLVFGSLLVLLHGGDFFFILRQILVVPTNAGGWNEPLPFLLTQGFWITPHLAAFIGAALALIAGRLRPHLAAQTRFESFWLWLITIGYAVLFYGELSHKLFFFSREGLYATMFIPFSMIGFGLLLFRTPTTGLFAVTAAVAAGSVLLRLGIQDGVGLSAYLRIPVPVLGVTAGALLVLAFVCRRRGVTLAVLVMLGLLDGFNGWHFTADGPIRAAHARILRDTGSRLPIFLFDDADPAIGTVWSVVGTFTDRALFTSRTVSALSPAALNGNAVLKPLWGKAAPVITLQDGDPVVILSSSEDRVDATTPSTLFHLVREAKLVDSFRAGDLQAHVFTVTSSH